MFYDLIICSDYRNTIRKAMAAPHVSLLNRGDIVSDGSGFLFKVEMCESTMTGDSLERVVAQILKQTLPIPKVKEAWRISKLEWRDEDADDKR